MKVLGISGRERDAAAALAVDGSVVAASAEECFAHLPHIGYAHTGGFPSGSVAACISGAGFGDGDIDVVAVACDETECDISQLTVPPVLRGVPLHRVDLLEADAIQARLSSPGTHAVLVGSVFPSRLEWFTHDIAGVQDRRAIVGSDNLVTAARVVADALGADGHDPFCTLDAISSASESPFLADFREAMRWIDGAMVIDLLAIQTLLRSIAVPGRLSDARSVNVRVQQTRRSIADGFATRVAELVAECARPVWRDSLANPVVLGGSLFSHPRLNARVRQLVGRATLAPVPDVLGRAIGAALAVRGGAPVQAVSSLSLGPAFGDAEIKRTLDNCRLDYVYEPDWQRVLARASKMLAQGKVVAWFQGPMAFGPRALGTRSVLADPSNRYARYNINEYYRQVSVDEPLPLVFAPSIDLSTALTTSWGPFSSFDAGVLQRWRDRLTPAVDTTHGARVQTLANHQAPELQDLLEFHLRRTGVPALIETNLAGPGEPVACTPRDAVRVAYSTAVDALIMGRFVLMKDFWLLRSHGD